MSSSAIDICSSDDDDDIPVSSGFKISTKSIATNNCNNQSSNGKRQLVDNTNHATHDNHQNAGLAFVSPTHAGPVAKKAKTKATTPNKVYSLIWVCTHGKGQSRSWTKKYLKIMGVYGTKNAAEQAKRQLMDQYECCGHGDILVGGCWDDEIDLVIRESPLHL